MSPQLLFVPFDVLVVLIRVGDVRRYSPQVPEPSQPEISPEGAKPHESMIVPFQIQVMRTEKTPEEPKEVRPKCALQFSLTSIDLDPVRCRSSHRSVSIVFLYRSAHLDYITSSSVRRNLSLQQSIYSYFIFLILSRFIMFSTTTSTILNNIVTPVTEIEEDEGARQEECRCEEIQ